LNRNRVWKFRGILEGHESEVKSVSFAMAPDPDLDEETEFVVTTCSRDKTIWIFGVEEDRRQDSRQDGRQGWRVSSNCFVRWRSSCSILEFTALELQINLSFDNFNMKYKVNVKIIIFSSLKVEQNHIKLEIEYCKYSKYNVTMVRPFHLKHNGICFTREKQQKKKNNNNKISLIG